MAIMPRGRALLRSAGFFLQFALIGLGIAVLVNFAWSGLTGGPLSAPHNLGELQASFAAGVERAAPSVVNVYVDKLIEQRPVTILRDPRLSRFAGRAIFGRPRYLPRNELGSGVIVSEQGFILTNYHVIRGAEDIRVSLWDGRLARARIVGFDEETDIAVLTVALDGLPTATFADADQLRVGDVALAIGNPFGLGKTVTMGIVSGTGRADLKVSLYEDFIQTDAAINRGNSGGALIDSAGRVIGINTAMLEHEEGAEGIGFAIPIDLALDVMQQILTNGHVVRGWLGVELEDPSMMPQIAAAAGNVPGLVVAGVYPNGPADVAGVQPGDYLIAFNGEPVGPLRELLGRIAAAAPGEEVALTYIRGGIELAATARLIQRPPRLLASG